MKKRDSLTTVIERSKSEQNDFSLKGAIATGRKVAAKAPAQSLYGRITSGIISAAKFGGRVAQKALPKGTNLISLARQSGKLPLPGDAQLKKLEGWAGTLRRLKLQTESIQNTKLKQLLNQRTAQADAAYDQASKAIREGQASAVDANRYIMGAQTAIKLVQSQILALKIPSMSNLPENIVGNYTQAERSFNSAKSRLESAIAIADKAQAEFSGRMGVKQTLREGGKALVDTGGSFASRAGQTFEDIGEGASKAIEATSKGLKEYGQYIPMVLIVGGVAYIVAVSGVLRGRMGYKD